MARTMCKKQQDSIVSEKYIDYVSNEQNIRETTNFTRMILFRELQEKYRLNQSVIHNVTVFSILLPTQEIVTYSTVYWSEYFSRSVTIGKNDNKCCTNIVPRFTILENALANSNTDIIDIIEDKILSRISSGDLSINCVIHHNDKDERAKYVKIIDERRMPIIILIIFILQRGFQTMDRKELLLLDVIGLPKEWQIPFNLIKNSLNKIFTLSQITKSLKTSDDIHNIDINKIGIWRDIEIYRRISDLSINFICPAIPLAAKNIFISDINKSYFEDATSYHTDLATVFLFELSLGPLTGITNTNIDHILFQSMFALYCMHTKLYMTHGNISTQSLHKSNFNGSNLFILNDIGYLFDQDEVSPLFMDFESMFGPRAEYVHGHGYMNNKMFVSQKQKTVELLSEIVPLFETLFEERVLDSPECVFRLLCYIDYLHLGVTLLKLSRGHKSASLFEQWARGEILLLIRSMNNKVSDNDVSEIQLPVDIFNKYIAQQDAPHKLKIINIYNNEAKILNHIYPYHNWPYWATVEAVKFDDFKKNIESSIKKEERRQYIVDNNEVLPQLRHGVPSKNY